MYFLDLFCDVEKIDLLLWPENITRNIICSLLYYCLGLYHSCLFLPTFQFVLRFEAYIFFLFPSLLSLFSSPFNSSLLLLYIIIPTFLSFVHYFSFLFLFLRFIFLSFYFLVKCVGRVKWTGKRENWNPQFFFLNRWLSFYVSYWFENAPQNFSSEEIIFFVPLKLQKGQCHLTKQAFCH